MTACPSIHDKYGVQCTSGMNHESYYLHLWQGETEHGPNTVVVWSTEEDREHMTAEREFFAHAEKLAVSDGWPWGSYQDVIKELLLRVKK